jgi:hypothetical protein
LCGEKNDIFHFSFQNGVAQYRVKDAATWLAYEAKKEKAGNLLSPPQNWIIPQKSSYGSKLEQHDEAQHAVLESRPTIEGSARNADATPCLREERQP